MKEYNLPEKAGVTFLFIFGVFFLHLFFEIPPEGYSNIILIMIIFFITIFLPIFFAVSILTKNWRQND